MRLALVSSSQTIYDTRVKLGEGVKIDEFFLIFTKYGDLDLDFTLQWTLTSTDIDFSLLIWMAFSVVIPSSYLMINGLIDLDEFYLMVALLVNLTLTSWSRSYGILG